MTTPLVTHALGPLVLGEEEFAAQQATADTGVLGPLVVGTPVIPHTLGAGVVIEDETDTDAPPASDPIVPPTVPPEVPGAPAPNDEKPAESQLEKVEGPSIVPLTADARIAAAKAQQKAKAEK